jgi:DNA helicase II / ATP-dependent DNA helicase PcrA
MRHLDPQQSAAAMGLAPIQLTLAGPGSGKTSTLTGRFVYLVRQGVDPTRILAVTFTKKAADEMRVRVARLLDLQPLSNLHVMTFHAFAYRLLKSNPAAAGLPERFQLWDTPEQRRVFSARQMWWNEEEDILDIIGGAKECLLDAESFAATIDDHDVVLMQAAKYFRVYEQVLQDAGAIDFADMVPLAVKAMDRNKGYRRSITGAYDHLLIDEYQDVNPGQIELIDRFVNDGIKLWAVGDDDQTLYAFRASDVRYILEFRTKYPSAEIHVLNRNYRSSRSIILAAKRLIRQNRRRLDKDYQPTIDEQGELVVRGYSLPEIEAQQVALAIVKLIQLGWAPRQIALLYRTGAIGLPFQTALQDQGIPFEMRGGADLWQGVAAKLVVGALYYLREGESASAMSRLGSNKRSQNLRKQLDSIKKLRVEDFKASCKSVQRIVSDVVSSQASNREKAEWQTVVDAVVGLALSCSSPNELESKIDERSKALRHPPKHAVTLSTIHSAKGLEWDAVFMVGMEDGVLPHAKSDDVEEERRVAYVGMTRARRLLGLTYSAERYNESSKPSRFLFEVSGRDKRLCSWTGPRLEGADDRLPLMTAEEKRRFLPSSQMSALDRRETSARKISRTGKLRKRGANRTVAR